MPCANCGKTYEEHASGLAYRDFTGAGTECGGYEELAGRCLGCGDYVTIDCPPDGHTRSEHAADCKGLCHSCPIPVLCGPVQVGEG